MIQTAQKKIKEAEANGGAPSTPAKSPSKKRKGKGDDDGGAAPSKKKGGKGAKKAAAPVDGMISPDCAACAIADVLPRRG